MVLPVVATAGLSALVIHLVLKARKQIEATAGYLVATKLILPEWEKLKLENLVGEFIKDPQDRDKVIKLLREDKYLRRTQDFIDFLREFNLRITKTSLKMSIISPTWGYQTSQLLNAISWSYGFGWLSWIGLSPILNHLVANPASDTLSREFPEKGLTKSEIMKLYKQGKINEQTARMLLAEMGYTREAIDLTFLLTREEKVEKEKDLTKSEILKAYREGILSRDDVVIKLRALGYSDDEIQILLELNKDVKSIERKTRERDLSVTQIIKAYKLNLVTEEELREYLKKLGYDDREIEILIKIYTTEKEIEKHERSRDLSKSEIVNAFLLGLISFEDAKMRLKQLGYDDDEAELILAIAYLKKYGGERGQGAGGETQQSE